MTQPDKLTSMRSAILSKIMDTPFDIGSQQKYLWNRDAEPLVDAIMQIVSNIMRENERLRSVIYDAFYWDGKDNLWFCGQNGDAPLPEWMQPILNDYSNKESENFQKYWTHYADKHYGQEGFPLDRPCPICPDQQTKTSEG